MFIHIVGKTTANWPKEPAAATKPIAKERLFIGATFPAILTIVAIPAPPSPKPISVVPENNLNSDEDTKAKNKTSEPKKELDSNESYPEEEEYEEYYPEEEEYEE